MQCCGQHIFARAASTAPVCKLHCLAINNPSILHTFAPRAYNDGWISLCIDCIRRHFALERRYEKLKAPILDEKTPDVLGDDDDAPMDDDAKMFPDICTMNTRQIKIALEDSSRNAARILQVLECTYGRFSLNAMSNIPVHYLTIFCDCIPGFLFHS